MPFPPDYLNSYVFNVLAAARFVMRISVAALYNGEPLLQLISDV